MAALLVAMSVMAILMTAAMPVWKQMAQREKEAELVFRGEQYVHAIQLYQRRAGPGTYPPSIDFLVEQKFLRKKYKDPITGGDFVPVPAVAPVAPGGAGIPGIPGSSPSPTPGGRATSTSAATQQPVIGPGGAVPGGVAGVVSKSTDKSIRIFNGQTHYNEWVFRALAQAPAGAGAPGQRGAPGPGGPGQPPAGIPNPGGQRGPQRGGRGGPGDGRGRFGAGFPPPPAGGPGGGAAPLQGGRGFTVLPNGQVVPANPPGR